MRGNVRDVGISISALDDAVDMAICQRHSEVVSATGTSPMERPAGGGHRKGDERGESQWGVP